MADDLHIKISFNSATEAITRYYAVNDKVQGQLWALEEKPTASELNRWLERNGGKLDRQDGPAVTRYYGDEFGQHCEETWYKNGQRHRMGAPALIDTCSDGSRYESCIINGRYIESYALPTLESIPGVSLLLKGP